MIVYNDNDAYVCRWLRNLMLAGHLPPGIVDDRSIIELPAAYLRPFRQCHFFAGIGGWPLALQLAEWPAEREVWTGSCPCQPLSVAGQRQGHADARHLWPAFYRLIAECRPATVFGEQVASKDGREWLAGVRADLEALGYAVGAADMPAAGVGAPHIRQRLFWVANAGRQSDEPWRYEMGGSSRSLQSKTRQRQRLRADVGDGCDTGWLGNAREPRLAGWSSQRRNDDPQRASAERTGGQWGSNWLLCFDGKARRIEPTIFPLANAGEWGSGSRMGILRAAGNAIVPHLAAEFICAFMEI